MKNKLLILVAIAFASGTMLTSCNSLNKKADASQDKVQDAKHNVAEANLDLNLAIEEFKKKSVDAIAANEKNIAEFKAKIADENTENKTILEKKLDEMEQKNNELKEKLADYKNNGNEQWNEFKDEFSHDMNKLGKAFHDLTVKNTK